MAHQDSVLIISSSPEFPSICDLLPKPAKQPLRSGRSAAAVPDDAPTTFTSATKLWQALRTQEDGVHNANGIPDTRPSVSMQPCFTLSDDLLSDTAQATEPGLEREKGKAEQEVADQARKKPKGALSYRAMDEPLADDPVAEAPAKKPARKPRPTKGNVMAQTTLPKGKVTKPAAKGAQKNAETVSRHFVSNGPAPVPGPERRENPVDDEPVILEPAMKRRTDWTPPRQGASYCPVDVSPVDLASSSAPARADVFKTLQENFGCTAEREPSAPLNPEVLGKRKLIEMVSSGSSRRKPPEETPTKPKAPKKKARTITELATAAYRQSETEDSAARGSKQGPLHQSQVPNAQSESIAKTVTKAKASRKSAKPKAKPTKKKGQAPKQLLLSPTSAMRQVAQQDFVFGTASQLATEEDPELLRALHEAMKASNQPDSDPFGGPSPISGSLAIRKRRGAGLWAAGARVDGELVDMEVLDLTRSSPLSLARLSQQPQRANQEGMAREQSSEEACIEIDMPDGPLDFSRSPVVSHPKQALLSETPLVRETIEINSSSPAFHEPPQSPLPESDLEPPPSNQEQHQLLLSQSTSPRQQAAPPPRPNFELFTDARLAKEVASYGFKAIKKRTAMIALLNQCWESRHHISLGTAAHRVAMSTSANPAGSPSRPRGRPRKEPVATGPNAAGPTAVPKRGTKSTVTSTQAEAPDTGKRRPGRPRKNSAASSLDAAEAPISSGRREKGSASASEAENEPLVTKTRSRGRPQKDAGATQAKTARRKASPKRAKSPTKAAAAIPRRRKPQLPATDPTIEIPDSDSDDPFHSTPPSSPPGQADVFSPSPPPVDLSLTEDTEDASLVASPTSRQVALFRHITQAVVSAPRSADAGRPSWHEKMLMYDPVILEDLTAWLNAGQLDRVGYDGEVAPADVKKWCESKSVCCLWRVNLRGKERKRL